MPSPAFRGTPQTGIASNGADVTLTFDVAPLEGDLVVVWGGHGNDGASGGKGPTTAGYTLRTAISGTDVDAGLWYKVMGATPDSTVVCEGGADAGDGVVYQCAVIQAGTFDAATPFDVADASTGYVTGVPNGPSITTVTDSCRIFVVGFGSVHDTSRGTVSGYTLITGNSVNETDDFACEAAYLDQASLGAADPPAWSTWASSPGGAITFAIRPSAAPPDQNLTGTSIASTVALFAAAVAYVVAPPAIAAGSTPNAPTVAYAVTTPAIPGGVTLSAPTLAYEVTAPAIASGAVLSAPTASQEDGAQSLTGAFIASGGATNTPTLTYAVDTPTLGSAATLNAPTVALGVDAPAIPAGSVLVAPTVALDGHAVGGVAILSDTALYAPSVSGEVRLSSGGVQVLWLSSSRRSRRR